ncbi:DivIVA domain-containing protein [Arthrobacter sp. A5]|uniref:DivIVA domain-containing protein n=1 Tax=Arthrobacter sp. A5 TaxID=576926 RepID=UPI003DA92B0B
MTYFLIFLAIAVAGAVASYVVGLNKASAGTSAAADDGFTAPVANLPPVLLPEIPQPEDVDRLRFSLGLRGYRMDQVDEVLDRLRDQLAAKDARITELESLPRGESAL